MMIIIKTMMMMIMMTLMRRKRGTTTTTIMITMGMMIMIIIKANTSSFVHHFKSIGELKLDLQSGNAQFGSKSVIFLSHVTLKFDGWPWKTIGNFFYTTLSFVHHFKAIAEFKLELQSRITQFGSKSEIFLSHVTLKFDEWVMDDLEK